MLISFMKSCSNGVVKLVVGLPGAGKSFYLQSLEDYAIVDDITDLNQIDRSVEKIAIADVHFCNGKTLEAAIIVLRNIFPTHDFHIEYFSNNPQKSIENVTRRNDGRYVIPTIKKYTEIYDPPYISHKTYGE